MKIEDALVLEAKRYADQLQDRRPNLEIELLEIETRKAQIEAQLDTLKRAHTRLLDYRPCIGTDFQCPRCWVEYKPGATLRPIPSSTHDDIMRCNVCNGDIVIPGR
jgi:hypothetical protein